MTLFSKGPVALTDVRVDAYNVDPDALTDEDVATAAMQIARVVGPFREVEAAGPSDARLVAALEPYQVAHGPLLIVAGVCTGPAAFEDKLAGRDPTTTVGFAIFNRGEMPRWCQALWNGHSAIRS